MIRRWIVVSGVRARGGRGFVRMWVCEDVGCGGFEHVEDVNIQMNPWRKVNSKDTNSKNLSHSHHQESRIKNTPKSSHPNPHSSTKSKSKSTIPSPSPHPITPSQK